MYEVIWGHQLGPNLFNSLLDTMIGRQSYNGATYFLTSTKPDSIGEKLSCNLVFKSLDKFILSGIKT